MNLKKLLAIPVFLLGLFICFQLTRSLIKIWRGGGRAPELRREVLSLQAEKERLEAEKAYRQTPEFVEEQARNKLQMVKEGERVVVLPRSAVGERGEEGQEGAREKRNWQRWAEYWLK